MVDPVDFATQSVLPSLFGQASALHHPAEGSCLRVWLPSFDMLDPAVHTRRLPSPSNHHCTCLRFGQQAVVLLFPRSAVFFRAELVRYSALDFLLLSSDLHV